MDIVHDRDSEGLPQLIESMTEGGAKSKVKGLAEGAEDAFGDDDEHDESNSGDDEDDESKRRSRSSSRSRSRSSSPRSRRTKSGG